MGKSFLGGEKSVVIDRTPKEVFDYLADMSRHQEWNGEAGFTVTRRPEAGIRVGSVFETERNEIVSGPLMRGAASGGPVAMVKTMTVTTLEPQQWLSFETKNRYNGLLHSVERVRFGLTPEGCGTRVTMVTELESMLPGPYLSPLYALYILKEAVLGLFSRWARSRYPALFVGPYLSRIKGRAELDGVRSAAA